jgi:hypothetical protein
MVPSSLSDGGRGEFTDAMVKGGDGLLANGERRSPLLACISCRHRHILVFTSVRNTYNSGDYHMTPTSIQR